MDKKEVVSLLNLQAKKIRQNIVKMIHEAKSGHTAGSLGMTDVFTALYFSFLNVNPKKPKDPDRDYLILSNGHICPVLYATLAARGFFKEQELFTLRKFESRLQGHPHRESL
ncbi:transketolase, partial [Candidatus Woesearchaeota archaeon CG10_big_fil_rev_8_21_14_0_10_32_9]